MTRRVGSYTLHDQIGAGGMAIVWSATHTPSGRPAAVKLMREDAAGSSLATFAEEIRAIAMVDHPYVVRLYDQGVADRPWLAMERANHTLRRPTSFAELVAQLSSVLSGLAAVHAMGLLHLDLKPSNVLVRADATLALADFGIALLRGAKSARHWGSPPYMAPERFHGGQLGPATDLYALGCMGFELACGRTPFPAVAWAAAARSHSQEEVPPLRPTFPVPTAFHEWLRVLLRKAPEERFAHAADARHALQLCLTQPMLAEVHSEQPTQLAPTVATVAGGVAGNAPAPAALAPPSVRPPLPRTWELQQQTKTGATLLQLQSVPFIGRQDAREALWSALLEAERGGSPCLVIRGPLGVGRTRLGEELARQAAMAGCEVLRDDSRAQTGRTVLRWIDDYRAGAELNPAPGTLTVAAVCDQQDGAETCLSSWPAIRLAPLDERTTRTLLGSWAGLPPSTTAELAELCAGDLRLALDMVRESFVDGTRGTLQVPESSIEAWEPHVPRPVSPLLGLAALQGRSPTFELLEKAAPREEVQRLANELVASGLAHTNDTGWAWASEALRLAIARTQPTSRHLELAALLPASWKRGVHLHEGGQTMRALDDLFEDASDHIARGQMVTAAARLASVEHWMESASVAPSDISWARLWSAMATLGPTHQGYTRCRALHERILQAAEAHLDREDWQAQANVALTQATWLANVQLLPHVAGSLLARRRSRGPDAGALEHEAWYQLTIGNPRNAERCFRASLERPESSRHALHTVPPCIAVTRTFQGIEGSIEELHETGDAMLGAGYLSAEGDLAFHLGNAYRLHGRFTEALPHNQTAVRIAEEGQARADIGFPLSLAITLRRIGRLEEASSLLESTISMFHEDGETWWTLLQLHRIALQAEMGGQVEPDPLREALKSLRRTGYCDPDTQLVLAELSACTADSGLQEELQHHSEALAVTLREGGALVIKN